MSGGGTFFLISRKNKGLPIGDSLCLGFGGWWIYLKIYDMKRSKIETYCFVEARASIVRNAEMASFQFRLKPVEGAIHVDGLLHTVTKSVG